MPDVRYLQITAEVISKKKKGLHPKIVMKSGVSPQKARK